MAPVPRQGPDCTCVFAMYTIVTTVCHCQFSVVLYHLNINLLQMRILTESVTTRPVVTAPRKKTNSCASGFDRVTPDVSPKNRCSKRLSAGVGGEGVGTIESRGETDEFFDGVGHYVTRSDRRAQKSNRFYPGNFRCQGLLYSDTLAYSYTVSSSDFLELRRESPGRILRRDGRFSLRHSSVCVP